MLAPLARTATRRPRTVLALWFLLLVVGLGFGTRVFGDLTSTVEDVPGSESRGGGGGRARHRHPRPGSEQRGAPGA
ncbi:hypothetical protein, partial [Streptomyces lasiicapitis]|uniref:hypothetical protein n=1 Tax=Streptomyces lasiicapitis TaxID=1923961 RepID=UPI00366802B1